MKRAIRSILASSSLAATVVATTLATARAAHAQPLEPAPPSTQGAPGASTAPVPPLPPPPPPLVPAGYFGPGDAEPRLPEDPHALPRHARVALMLRGGPAYRVLYGTPIAAGSIDLGIGAETKRGTIYGTIGGLFGATELGLGVRQGMIGAVYEYPFGRLRLGVHPRLGYFGVDRVTVDDSFETITAGLGGIASIDVWRPSTAALVLGVEPVIDAVLPLFGDDPDSAGLYGVNGYLAVRWRDL